MEVLAPAGNREKLEYAYRFGADAAYIGLKDFSLRSNAGNFDHDDADIVGSIKDSYGRDSQGNPNKRLLGAVNSYFHQGAIPQLENQLERIERFPFDGLIVSDMGAFAVLRKTFPHMKFHLSTQANCLNAEAAKVYRDLGFARIILGREASLRDVERIKSAAPEMEIEIFVHGAMCMAYSGRCYLSRHLTGRSANQGDCAHTCRWEFRWLEERERPGEYFPVHEEDGFTTILSSRDLCMIDHIEAIRDAGVDSVKIEGSMKSAYYTAVVTRAYRKAVDRAMGQPVPDFEKYRDDLVKVSHREYSTGFFFDTESTAEPAAGFYIQKYLYLGTIGERIGHNTYRIRVKNRILHPEPIEYIGPDVPKIVDSAYTLLDSDGTPISQADHNKDQLIRTSAPIEPGFLMRKKIEEK